jgi:ADP-ribosylation factor GTPase-activating protein 1
MCVCVIILFYEIFSLEMHILIIVLLAYIHMLYVSFFLKKKSTTFVSDEKMKWCPSFRSLGVHISFVRSIAMDSWTPAQLKIMKAGGNDSCNSFLHARGVSKQATIQEKYNSDAAALYKEVLKARAEGRPEPTSLPPPSSTKTTRNSNISSSISNSSSSKPSGSLDPNGMERLLGETDEEYIARQTRLRDEAKARMAAKFGSTGGKMGGVGSSPHPGSYQPSGPSSFNMDSIADTLSSGFGSAFSFAKQGISTVQSSAVTKDVASVGFGLWSSLKSSVSEVANVAQNALGEVIPGDGGGNDGMAALNQQMRRERDSRVASSSMNSNQNSSSSFASGSGTSNGYASSSSSVALSSSDHNSVAPLPGESNEEYMQRQMKIHQQASSAKTASASSSVSKKSGTKMQVNKDDTDFFSSFGA